MRMKTRYKWKMAIVLLIVASSSFAEVKEDFSYQSQKLCPKVLLLFNLTDAGIDRVDLTPLEEALICGDPSVKEWQNIPSEQAALHLQALLQARGYHHVTTKGRRGDIKSLCWFLELCE